MEFRTTNAMKKLSSPTAFFAIVLMTLSNPSHALKCWTTEDGTRACGDSVPPQYVQKGYEKKNAHGMTVERQEAARTVEDVEAEYQAEREAKAAAIIAEKQARLDKNLLDTFASEDDMLYARDGQLAHLDGQINLTETRNEKLQESLDKLVRKAAGHERGGKEPPESLLKDIYSLEGQIKANSNFIDSKRNEQKAILEKFENDIQRFRKLSGNNL